MHEAFFREEAKKTVDDLANEEPKSKPPEAEKPTRLFNASFSADLELPQMPNGNINIQVLPFFDEESISFMQPTESDDEVKVLKTIGESVPAPKVS